VGVSEVDRLIDIENDEEAVRVELFVRDRDFETVGVGGSVSESVSGRVLDSEREIDVEFELVILGVMDFVSVSEGVAR